MSAVAVPVPFTDASRNQFMSDCPVGSFTRDGSRAAPSGRIAAQQCLMVADWYVRFLFAECLAAAGIGSQARAIRSLAPIESEETMRAACEPLKAAYRAAESMFSRESVSLGLYRNRIARDAAKRAMEAAEGANAVTALLIAATNHSVNLAGACVALRALERMPVIGEDAGDLQRREKLMNLQMHIPGGRGLGFQPSTIGAKAAVVADEALAGLKAKVDIEAANLLARMIALEAQSA